MRRGAIINVSARTNGPKKGQAATAAAFVRFWCKKSQMWLPIIICNRGRKGERVRLLVYNRLHRCQVFRRLSLRLRIIFARLSKRQVPSRESLFINKFFLKRARVKVTKREREKNENFHRTFAWNLKQRKFNYDYIDSRNLSQNLIIWSIIEFLTM